MVSSAVKREAARGKKMLEDYSRALERERERERAFFPKPPGRRS
jgi:hypothetical protein